MTGRPRVREHGYRGRSGAGRATVLALHGGPGAPGTIEPVARRLAERFHVIEPFERRSGGEPLTVARHVEDLRALVDERCGKERPGVVGHSWGAMMALAAAAAYPRRFGPLVLVGCGTFDPVSRARLKATRDARIGGTTARRLSSLEAKIADADERMAALGEVITAVDAHELAGPAPRPAGCDARGYRESWSDMIRLQDDGTYPAAFAAIESPVLMIHGRDDPHPGGMIRASLAPLVKSLEYLELKRCGHTPWLERHAAAEFHRVTIEWLDRHCDQGSGTAGARRSS